MMLLLREADNSDAETLLALIHAAFAEYIGNIDPPSSAPDETVEGIRRKMESAHAVLAVATDSPAGCVFFEIEKDHVYLFRLAVNPEHRRRGIGRTLIEFVEHRAIAEKRSRVRLGVRVSLPENRAYYERMGYRFFENRTHAGYSDPTYVILEKQLAGGAF